VPDYAFDTEPRAPRCHLGTGFTSIRRAPAPTGVKERRRCIDKAIGFPVMRSPLTVAAGERCGLCAYYRLCVRGRIPVADLVAHRPRRRIAGGDGVVLDDCHPRHLGSGRGAQSRAQDLAARPGWPWQAEVIAVLMHKRNIW